MHMIWHLFDSAVNLNRRPCNTKCQEVSVLLKTARGEA
jgi:hypothetical protein